MQYENADTENDGSQFERIETVYGPIVFVLGLVAAFLVFHFIWNRDAKLEKLYSYIHNRGKAISTIPDVDSPSPDSIVITSSTATSTIVRWYAKSFWIKNISRKTRKPCLIFLREDDKENEKERNVVNRYISTFHGRQLLPNTLQTALITYYSSLLLQGSSQHEFLHNEVQRAFDTTAKWRTLIPLFNSRGFLEGNYVIDSVSSDLKSVLKEFLLSFSDSVYREVEQQYRLGFISDREMFSIVEEKKKLFSLIINSIQLRRIKFARVDADNHKGVVDAFRDGVKNDQFWGVLIKSSTGDVGPFQSVLHQMKSIIKQYWNVENTLELRSPECDILDLPADKECFYFIIQDRTKFGYGKDIRIKGKVYLRMKEKYKDIGQKDLDDFTVG